MVKGSRHSEATRERMRKAKASPEVRARMAEMSRGKKASDETRARMSAAQKGKPKSAQHRENIAKALQQPDVIEAMKTRSAGPSNPMWAGGMALNSQGYVEIHAPGHPRRNSKGRVSRYRLVMEHHIGRYLEYGEVVHHIDGDKTNDNIENLMLFPNNGEHIAYHAAANKKK